MRLNVFQSMLLFIYAEIALVSLIINPWLLIAEGCGLLAYSLALWVEGRR